MNSWFCLAAMIDATLTVYKAVPYVSHWLFVLPFEEGGACILIPVLEKDNLGCGRIKL